MNMVGWSLGSRMGWRMEVGVTNLLSSADGESRHGGDTESGDGSGSAGKRDLRMV